MRVSLPAITIAAKDRNDFLLFDLSSKGGQKRWLLTFSLHCLCSSTSHLFTSRLRLVYWSTLKIANDLPIFASCYAFVIVSLTWLAYFLSHDYFSYINSLRFFLNLCFSLTKGLRSKRWTLLSISAVHQPFLYFDFFLYFDLLLNYLRFIYLVQLNTCFHCSSQC